MKKISILSIISRGNKHTLSLLLFILFFQFSIAGGGWPQPKNKLYLKIFQWWVLSDEHFTDTGGIDPNVTSGIFNTGVYGEYGITNRFTGIVYFPFYSRAYFNNTISGTTGETITPGEAINSVGDAIVSAKYGLIVNGPIILSATISLGLPLGVDDGGSNNTLQTGDGEFNQLLRFDASTSANIGGINTFYNIYAGINNRTNGFSDELWAGVEAGATLWEDKIIGLARLYTVQSLQNGDSNDIPNSTSIFANNSEHLTISPELGIKITDQIGISGTAAFPISGRLIFSDPSYSAGIFLEL